MKTVKTTLLIFAAAIVTNFVSATGNLSVNIAPAGAGLALVEITNLDKSNFDIELKDQYGEVIFSKKSEETSAYKKAYDLSQLVNGTYHLTVEIDKERIDNKLVLKDGLIMKHDQKKMIEPYFMFVENKFKMSYLNFHGEDMKLMVYKGNELISEKELDYSFAVEQGLDFSKAERGEYRVVFRSGDRFFGYNVEKN
jgi:hypothetical protein